jgi:hypothetical protein
MSRSTTSTASARLSSGRRLGSEWASCAAARAGSLSAEQAMAVSDAAAADPSAEEHLVGQAARSSLGELRDTCSRVKAAADPDRDATHERIRAARRVRRWSDGEGGWNVVARSVPEDGAEVNAALDDLAGELFAEARAAGRHEPHEAYLLDALVELARRHNRSRRAGPDGSTATPSTGGRAGRPGYVALLRVDVEALQRGKVEADELCEIAGVGPVPVRVARQLLGDAVLKVVITRGVDVASVTHLGRGPTAAQRVALLWRDPQCTVLGCNQPWREADHLDDWASCKVNELRNLDGLCHHHHALKTRENWALVAGAGRRPMVPPDHPDHPRNRGAPPGHAPPTDLFAGVGP